MTFVLNIRVWLRFATRNLLEDGSALVRHDFQCFHPVFTLFSPCFHPVFSQFSPCFHPVFTLFSACFHPIIKSYSSRNLVHWKCFNRFRRQFSHTHCNSLCLQETQVSPKFLITHNLFTREKSLLQVQFAQRLDHNHFHSQLGLCWLSLLHNQPAILCHDLFTKWLVFGQIFVSSFNCFSIHFSFCWLDESG